MPPGTPGRREVLATLSLLALLAGLLFGQVTLGLAVALHATGKITRWRPVWLAIPAAAGLVWILAIGPGTALAGLTAAPRELLDLLTRLGSDPARLAHLGSLPARPVEWFPGQFPAGLILAAAVAAAAWWLDWLHTDEWRLPAPRPGLAAGARRRLTAAFIGSGGVLSRTGAALGVVPGTGRPAVVGWPAAERGVLVTGAAPAAVAGSGFQLAHAAIRLRKPVIVVDLAASPGLPASLAEVCAAAGAPLARFGATGPGCYEPFLGGDPARNAALALGMIDWARAPEPARLGCQSVLTDVFAVAGAAPAEDGRAVLDDVAALLRPGALQTRMDRVPAYYPQRAALADRVATSAARLAADQAITSTVAGQLASLRGSPLGRWLGGVPAAADGSRISLASVIRQRGVVLFSLDRATYGQAADSIANLVARDLADIFTGLAQAGIGGDGLAWFGQCETADPQALAALVTAGTGSGLATVLSTTSAAAARRLASQAGVLVIHRLADGPLAGQLARLTGHHLVPAGSQPGYHVAPASGWPDQAAATGPAAAASQAAAATAVAGLASGAAGPVTAGTPSAAPPGADWAPVMTGEAMCALQPDEFALVLRGAPDGVVPLAVSVTARIPGRPRAAAAGPVSNVGPVRANGPPPAWAAEGDGEDQPWPRPAQPGPSTGSPAAEPAGSDSPAWPGAPAWAGGRTRRERPR
ncbi:MAG TPA: hypothetical protein VIX86_23920 [Streptosporangiaceae bacterium]